MADDFRLTQAMAPTVGTAHGGGAMPPRGRKVKAGKGMRSHAAKGWQGADVLFVFFSLQSDQRKWYS